jgi:hypothetical protein
MCKKRENRLYEVFRNHGTGQLLLRNWVVLALIRKIC